jgi:hypothetical protein
LIQLIRNHCKFYPEDLSDFQCIITHISNTVQYKFSTMLTQASVFYKTFTQVFIGMHIKYLKLLEGHENYLH